MANSNDNFLPGDEALTDNAVSNLDATAEEDDDSNITNEELVMLDNAGDESEDEDDLNKSTLDNTDDDGEALNEDDGLSGNDLDVPGADLDDEDELKGEEDEENNLYSNSDTE